MPAPTLLEAYKFSPEATPGCESISTAGLKVYVAPLAGCLTLPVLHTLSLSAAAAAAATSITVFISLPLAASTPTLTLVAGRVLTFTGGKKVTVAQTVTITSTATGTPDTIQVDPIATALVTADTADVYPYYEVLGVTDAGQADNSQTQDTSVLRAYIGSMAVTRLAPKLSLTANMRDKEDLGFHKVLNPARKVGGRVHAFVKSPDGYYEWGPVLPLNFSKTRANAGIITYTLELDAQQKWAMPDQYDLLAVADKAIVDNMISLVGA